MIYRLNLYKKVQVGWDKGELMGFTFFSSKRNSQEAFLNAVRDGLENSYIDTFKTPKTQDQWVSLLNNVTNQVLHVKNV